MIAQRRPGRHQQQHPTQQQEETQPRRRDSHPRPQGQSPARCAHFPASHFCTPKKDTFHVCVSFLAFAATYSSTCTYARPDPKKDTFPIHPPPATHTPLPKEACCCNEL